MINSLSKTLFLMATILSADVQAALVGVKDSPGRVVSETPHVSDEPGRESSPGRERSISQRFLQ